MARSGDKGWLRQGQRVFVRWDDGGVWVVIQGIYADGQAIMVRNQAGKPVRVPLDRIETTEGGRIARWQT